MTLGACLKTTPRVVKGTLSNPTISTRRSDGIEMHFFAEWNLPLHSLHARICLHLFLLAKLTSCHADGSLPSDEVSMFIGAHDKPLLGICTRLPLGGQMWLAPENSMTSGEIYTKTNLKYVWQNSSDSHGSCQNNYISATHIRTVINSA